MRKHLTIAALTLSAAFAALPAAAEQINPTMTISATGTVSAEPDQAAVRFGVHSTGQEARQAMQQNKKAMAAALEAIEAADIPASDVVTTGLALNPRYEHYQSGDRNTPPRIVGYEAHNNVTVTVRQISSLGRLLDELVNNGVNGIDQVTFGMQDSSALETAARIKAAKAARVKAETYAEAIGTEITGVVSISEGGMRSPQPYQTLEMARVASSAVPVAAGEMDVSVSVNVVFSLDGTLK